MQNLKTDITNTQQTHEHPTLSFEDIVNYFYGNTKPNSEMKVGMEIERLPMQKDSLSQTSYFGESGVKRILETFRDKYNWEPIEENNFLLGLQKGNLKITLEPGAQTEISSGTHFYISQIEKEILEVEKKLDEIADEFGTKFFSVGVSPIDTYSSIKLIPKKRYYIMSELLSGKLAKVMMRETAGIQVALDYTSEKDAMKKLKIALMLSPFTLAMFSNSPVHMKKASGFKSFRATAWLDTDNKRCGLVSDKIFSNNENCFDFEQYAKRILEIPVLYFQRGGSYIIPQKKLSFADFISTGYDEFFPTMDDFLLHLNLFFPDVRLREYIELRNHDSLPAEFKFAPGALYKGILYSDSASDKILELFEDFEYSDFEFLRKTVPQNGMQTEIKGKTALEYSNKILEIAKDSLSKTNDSDAHYLEPIQQLIRSGKVPSDITLKEFEKIL